MIKLWNKIKNILKFWLLSLLVFPFLIWWVSYWQSDLLWELMDPAMQYNNTLNVWLSTNRVWKNVFEWSYDITLIDLDLNINAIKRDNDGHPLCEWWDGWEIVCTSPCSVVNNNNKEVCKDKRVWQFADPEAWGGITKTPSIIVKVTRLLLILVITLSVTMILYNWLIYIVQTWQWKEGKSLVKNIVYIVIWILISLFSVVIITIIQSVPETIDQEVRQESNNETDNKAVGDKEAAKTKSGKKLVRGSYNQYF